MGYSVDVLNEGLKDLFTQAADAQLVGAYARRLAKLDLDEADEQNADAVEAMLEVMYLMAASDGEVSHDELMLLSASLRAMLEPFEAGGGATMTLPLLHLDRELSRFDALYKEQGAERRVLSVAARLKTPESRCLAFCLATAIALVDDFVAGGEIEVIEDLAARLGLSTEESQNLLREVHTRMGV